MSLDHALTALVAASVGCGAAALLVSIRLEAPPPALMRRNVNNRLVPAVLGAPLAFGALGALVVALAAGASGWAPARVGRVGVAVVLLIVATGIAGGWDDRRGDERHRGFRGHLEAAKSGKVTGGLVKLVVVTAAAVGAGAVVADGGQVLATAALVALGANFVNLLDRAPGRAGKVALIVAAPVAILGSPAWTVAAAGLVGGLAACLPADLGERAMLGDAGANPLGAVVGLGLALSLGPLGQLVAIVVLAALNLASEKWSFSSVIAATPWLRALDLLGRKHPPAGKRKAP